MTPRQIALATSLPASGDSTTFLPVACGPDKRRSSLHVRVTAPRPLRCASLVRPHSTSDPPPAWRHQTPEREIVIRLPAAETKMPSLSLRSGALTPRDHERLWVHRERLSKSPITINAGSPTAWAPEVFLDSLDYMTAHPGVRLAVVDDAGRVGLALRPVLAEMSLLAQACHFPLVLVTGGHLQA